MSWKELRARLELTDADRLGRGAESEVYALDHERVLRIWKGATREDVERRAAFLATLDRTAVPFALPEILEVREEQEAVTTVEPQIHGVSLESLFPVLRGADRVRALESFADAASELWRAGPRWASFGDLLSDEPIRTTSWAGYLVAKLRTVSAASRPRLAQHLPDIEAILDTLESQLAAVDDVAVPKLVHGDYFHGNVMVDDTLTVSGVVDFSTHTIAGDPRMDLAGAVVQLDVFGTHQPDDLGVVVKAILRRHPDVAELLDLYSRWSAFYFSQWDAPELVRWAVAVLQTPPLTRPGAR